MSNEHQTAVLPHPLRGTVLAEVHARPFHPIETPRRLFHFAFMTVGEMAGADRRALAAWCEARGVPPPAEGARHHRAILAGGSLRWEQHAEFTTYTIERPAPGEPFTPGSGGPSVVMAGLVPPGPLLAATDLHMVMPDAVADVAALFDHASLAMSEVDGQAALVATDFRADADGFVRILVVDRGLGPARAGALAQRLLEVEAYRLLALLGLPEAQVIAPRVRAIEESLTRIASATAGASDAGQDHRLLDELTALAATLEADSTASGYRFGASRAYDGIVQQRLEAIRETAVEGWPTIEAFLSRRMAPAMRTCAMLAQRQRELAEKLSRAANLLRTRVDVEIERQNRDVLSSMNERTRLQLRLQQTVEGLSIAAVSYYVVGLISFLLKGLKDAGWLPFDVGIATAAAVPLVVVGMALTVRRIRRRHGADVG
jgi:uncharacterized membrane-anchored protein